MSAATDAIGAYRFIEDLYQSAVPRRARLSAPLQTPLVHIVLTAVCTDAGKARSSLPKFRKFYHSTPQDGMQA
jgi:hypothetical protein